MAVLTPGDVYFAGLGFGPMLFALATVFLAALVRGYCGFGLTALVVTSLTLVLPPTEAVRWPWCWSCWPASPCCRESGAGSPGAT